MIIKTLVFATVVTATGVLLEYMGFKELSFTILWGSIVTYNLCKIGEISESK